ncbi:uncharacterized protein LOC131953813 [Physella acuta]|uniref:uncharacterized protein LOC131953813 n=1 Tax=Physella acuta TaxID=109671 RepID=UPI0027DAC346|nr:uncharacterized protein LOC131953813 [Physella acuta]
MADFEANGVIVSDDELKPDVHSDSVKPVKELDSSNNSTTVQKLIIPDRYTSSGALRTQAERRTELIEQFKSKPYVYDEHTEALLSFLAQPNIDSRDFRAKVFRNQLMLSENMDEVPSSFAKNWITVVCPVGSRCLVVSSRGYTGAYTKSGYHIISHPSNLPFGNKMMQGGGVCLLDCIYCNDSETYFVLDVMCWDGQPTYSCDTQTRFKLLQEKLREFDLSRASHMNPYPFVAVKAFTPTKSNICGTVIATPYLIDGLLFFYKHATYRAGTTPCALWLTLDRLPSKLKIEIPELGIVTAVSYKDPVSLALAHGVSPAIISQVYPGSRHTRIMPRSAGVPARNFQNSGQNRRLPERVPPPFPHRFDQGIRGFNQPGQVYNSVQRSDRGKRDKGPNQAHPLELTEMMSQLYLHHNRQPPYPRRDQYVPASGSPYFSCNNNNSNSYNGSEYSGRRGQLTLIRKSKQLKKKNKHPQDKVEPNWEDIHCTMKSQWMEQKPENFDTDYLTCICPLAKRRIIVAAKGATCVYNKHGKMLETYTSSLPNGSPNASNEKGLVVLDSLWCGIAKKFYIIDVMHWRKQPFYDAEAAFRFFWLQDKITNVTLKSGKREWPLELLPKYPSDKATLLEALNKVDFKVDGLLCFEKCSIYSKHVGTNVLWLKLDMMGEILGYPPPGHISFKPITDKERKQRDYFINLKSGKVKVELTDGERGDGIGDGS